jgi:hypothetical protein
MKKLLLILVCVGCMTCCFGQEKTDVASRLNKEEYLRKSNNQKRAAGILFGIGSTALIIASTGNISFDAAIPLVIGGGAAILTSIPLFIASGKNKKKAKLATASIGLQPTFNPYHFSVTNIPALSLRLRL